MHCARWLKLNLKCSKQGKLATGTFQPSPLRLPNAAVDLLSSKAIDAEHHKRFASEEGKKPGAAELPHPGGHAADDDGQAAHDSHEQAAAAHILLVFHRERKG